MIGLLPEIDNLDLEPEVIAISIDESHSHHFKPMTRLFNVIVAQGHSTRTLQVIRESLQPHGQGDFFRVISNEGYFEPVGIETEWVSTATTEDLVARAAAYALALQQDT